MPAWLRGANPREAVLNRLDLSQAAADFAGDLLAAPLPRPGLGMRQWSVMAELWGVTLNAAKGLGGGVSCFVLRGFALRRFAARCFAPLLWQWRCSYPLVARQGHGDSQHDRSVLIGGVTEH